MKTTLTAFALALAASLSAAAPEDGLVVASAGLCFAQGDAQDLTNRLAGGYTFEAGYQISPKDFGPSVLFFAGYVRLPEGTTSAARPTYSLVGPHFGVEFLYKPWDSLPITLATGPALHVWQVTQTNSTTGTMGDQGLKLGWRVGVSYAIDRQWSVDLKYTLTEWGGGPTEAAQAYRPAYATLMGSYRF